MTTKNQHAHHAHAQSHETPEKTSTAADAPKTRKVWVLGVGYVEQPVPEEPADPTVTPHQPGDTQAPPMGLPLQTYQVSSTVTAQHTPFTFWRLKLTHS